MHSSAPTAMAEAPKIPLDALIKDLLQKESEIKCAMAMDEPEAVVERLDAEVSAIQDQILQFQARNSSEQKTLFHFLVDHYLSNGDVMSIVPKGLIDKVKDLYR